MDIDLFEDDGKPPFLVDAVSVRTSLAPIKQASDGLNDLQRAFVEAFCANGGKGEMAAIDAGYGGGAKNMATRNLAKPKIQAAIEQRIRAGKGTALAVAVNRLLDVIQNSTDEKAAVSAALGLMDRFGMSVPKAPLIDARSVNVTAGDASEVLRMVAERAKERAK